MSLRLKIHLIVGVLVALFVAVVVWLQLSGARSSVREEIEAASRVAGQLLQRTVVLQAAQGTPVLVAFLQSVGRVRANDIQVLDDKGQLLYQSPRSPYKAGREAPDWFSRIVSPPPTVSAIAFPDGKLVVTSDASRAVLDAWDQFKTLAVSALALLAAINVVVYWLVGRAVKPLGRVLGALNRLETGDLQTRLPPLPGQEAAALGAAFNRMAVGVGERIEAERRASQAERELSDRRDLARWIDRRLEQERKLIARELHDELGQSVTAVRSLAVSIAQRTATTDPTAADAARVIADESSRLYDAMHGLIPRLAPLVLDVFGLADALRDLAERTRRSQPQAEIALEIELGNAQLESEAALALYRAAQEGLTNALRHGDARHITVTLRAEDGGTALTVRDDGRGLPPDWTLHASSNPLAVQRDGAHYGLRWLTERVAAQHGRFSIANAAPAGTLLQVWLPTVQVEAEPA